MTKERSSLHRWCLLEATTDRTIVLCIVVFLSQNNFNYFVWVILT